MRCYRFARPVTDPVGTVIARPGDVCSDPPETLLEELGDAIVRISVAQFRELRRRRGTVNRVVRQLRPVSVPELLAVQEAKERSGRRRRSKAV